VTNLDIRPLRDRDDFRKAVELQQEIWGFADNELLPVRLFVVATKIGGHAFGAFDGHRIAAFLLAIPGIKDGERCYLHSHMLGVRPEYRNSGIGRRLKLAQREDALARGIDLVEWTFDPLELKNAYLNIERLGAIVRRYLPNQYGTTTSPLHGGLPTDRLVAEWWLRTPRARTISEGRAFERPPATARIAIPADIAGLRASDPSRAREIQQRAGGEFMEYFRRGLAVIGFERSAEAGTYLIGQWESS
jgi:predicted GNAT superfamily acetyltransferase